ncbi:MAG: flavodoxin-dependent (E)-4-hydroxy-3-methylbut-2-enyl-diphosphate synthase [bacterium]
MEIVRKKTRVIRIGNVSIGGDNPILVQTMTSIPAHDIGKTIAQIKKLEETGAEIIRVAVPDKKAAFSLGKIKKQMKVPLVADIHYDYKLAIESINQGADKIRINPGNIGGPERVRLIIGKARERNVPIRIGVNEGSLNIIKNNNSYYLLNPNRRAHQMVKELLQYIKIFESDNFFNLVLSLKSSDILTTVSAYKMISNLRDYPLHIGITEAGGLVAGSVRSSIGIGMLLSEGIGDTIRVSLSAHPQEEIKVGREILKSLSLRKMGPYIISCPTCGRCNVDIIGTVNNAEKMIDKLTKLKPALKKTSIKVAIMGCVVNGPGEARDADIGIAGGKTWGILFKKGKAVKRIKEKQWLPALEKEILSIAR